VGRCLAVELLETFYAPDGIDKDPDVIVIVAPSKIVVFVKLIVAPEVPTSTSIIAVPAPSNTLAQVATVPGSASPAPAVNALAVADPEDADPNAVAENVAFPKKICDVIAVATVAGMVPE
jgi:hypothetical protein